LLTTLLEGRTSAELLRTTEKSPRRRALQTRATLT
jgi:hypothetical protein